MKRLMKILCCFLIFTYIISLQAQIFAANNIQAVKPFSDVPKNNYAYSAINELRQLGVTDGIGNNRFGFGSLMTRGEFVTFLVRLMDWKQVTPVKGSFTDNQDKKKAWYSPVETALANGIISKDGIKFRPSENITNDEMAVMIVKSMGYGALAERLSYLNKPYADVTKNIGYVTIAKDTGIFNSKATWFNPSGKAFKEQAAVLLINLHHDLIRPLKDLNAFYAISSSSQQDKISDLSSVCFGWSELSFNESSGSIVINFSRNAAGLGNNDYYLPAGFTQRISTAGESGTTAMLMIQSSQDSKLTDPATGLKVGIPEYVLTKPEVYRKLITDIAASVKSISLGSETGSFDGVAIDIEGLKGTKLKQLFNVFLKELNAALDNENKKLFVAVQPLIHPKMSVSSMDGYDYAAIGSIADKVILMAHDYASTRLSQADMNRGFNITPLTPVEDVYYALEAITDVKSGVQDKSKIMLQISFDWTVWQKKDGKIINPTPASFSLENFIALLNSGIPISYQYSKDYGNPYLKYTDPKTGTENTVWYENTESVMDKIKLARLFGIQGISLWRLGSIPDYQPDDGRKLGMDIWQNILVELEKN
jgi:spore germination protein YaaH